MNNYLENQETFPVLIITGLSGSGKSTALRALEDIGYFCIDNLPIHLVPKFLELRAQITQEDVKVAFGMDVRTRGFVENYMNFFPTLRKAGLSITCPFFGGQRRNLNQTVQPDPQATSIGRERIYCPGNPKRTSRIKFFKKSCNSYNRHFQYDSP